MASQIEQLKASFDKMNTTQKKAFIDNLKQKLQGSNNAEYIRFLNECVQRYNVAVRGGSSPSVTQRTSSVLDDLTDDSYSMGNYVIAQPADRLLAYLIDFLTIVPIYVILGIQWIFIGLAENNAPYYSYYYGRYMGGDPSMQTMFSIISLVFAFLQLVYCIIILVVQIKHWKKGTSIGKKRMRLYVVIKDTGETISTGYMFLREVFGKWISGMIFSLGFIWILIDKDKQAWHDKLVSSVVVKR